jgi:predicted nucleic acid-binding protein
LIDHHDQHRERAVQLTALLDAERSSLLTTDAILVELLNYFSATRLRASAMRTVTTIRDSPEFTIVEINLHLFEAALARYQRFDDKNWSMTDCLSMEVMLHRGIKQVATTDRGFQQAGFEILLPVI